MADTKKCIFCKRTLVGSKKIPVCQKCLNNAGNTVAGSGILVGAAALKVLGGKKKYYYSFYVEKQ